MESGTGYDLVLVLVKEVHALIQAGLDVPRVRLLLHGHHLPKSVMRKRDGRARPFVVESMSHFSTAVQIFVSEVNRGRYLAEAGCIIHYEG